MNFLKAGRFLCLDAERFQACKELAKATVAGLEMDEPHGKEGGWPLGPECGSQHLMPRKETGI